MARWRPFVQGDSYMANKKWTPLVIGNGYTTTDGAGGPAPEYETVTGNPVSFNALTPFPLRQLSVAFSPKQDLHGYDSPWPAGGGKNILPNTYATATNNGVTFTVESDGTIKTSGTATGGDADFFLITAVALDGLLESGNTYFFSGCPSGGDTSTYFCRLNVVGKADTGSGFVQTFSGDTIGNFTIRIKNGTNSNGLVFKPQIVKSSVAVAWTPYSNLCPILGWDEVTVTIANQNVVSESFNKALGQSEGSYVVTNTAGTSLLFRCVAGTTYYLLRGADANRKIWGFFKDKPAVSDFVDAPAVDAWSAVAPLTGWCMVYLKNAWDESLVNTSQVSITEESTVVPPVTRSITISLGSTVYSGTVDVVTGVVTVTMASVDLGTLDWMASSGRVQKTVESVQRIVKPTSSYDVPANLLCSAYKTLTATAVYSGNIGVGVTGLGAIKLHDTAFADMTFAEVKAALSGVQAVYELATPIEIQLTPQEGQSLAGDNVLFSDANGNLTVEYRSN